MNGKKGKIKEAGKVQLLAANVELWILFSIHQQQHTNDTNTEKEIKSAGRSKQLQVGALFAFRFFFSFYLLALAQASQSGKVSEAY